MKHFTITVFGFGNIGRTIVHQLLQEKSLKYTINIFDPSDQVSGSWLDLNNSAQLHLNHKLVWSCKNTFNQSDFIFHCAGKGIAKGASRLAVVEENKKITKEIFTDFKPTKDPKIIVLSNPVDIISYYTWKYSGLKPSSVIGTGTLLDTQRLNFYIKEKIGHQHKVESITMGEHGASIVWLKSHSFINDLPLLDCLTKDEQGELYQNMLDAASQIKLTQGASIYGVADCALFIMNEFINSSNIIFTASVMIPLSYKELLPCNTLFMSVPIRIEAGEIVYLDALAVLPEELLRLQETATIIESFLEK